VRDVAAAELAGPASATVIAVRPMRLAGSRNAIRSLSCARRAPAFEPAAISAWRSSSSGASSWSAWTTDGVSTSG
jgi:hypothetical protein